MTDFKRGNLKGTARTLDGTTGAVPLDTGLVSTEGVGVLDDSKSLILNKDGTISPRAHIEKDLYYFAYDKDYRGAVRDFFKLSILFRLFRDSVSVTGGAVIRRIPRMNM